MDIVGLIPAAGKAARLSPLPCSKELYPIAFQRSKEGEHLRPKVVCHYLLEKMRLAGISKVYIVLRDGKWDIPSYFGDGTMVDMNIAYLMMRLPFGAPYTLDQAYPFVKNAMVAIGFPDILFNYDDNVFEQLLKRQASTNAEAVLGLFPTDHPHKWDMVDIDDNGQVKQILTKPSRSDLQYSWVIAVWTPVFTRFMHEHLSSLLNKNRQEYAINDSSVKHELFVGNVFQAAIQNDLMVDSVVFSKSSCIDIGTPDDLIGAIHQLNQPFE